MAWIPEKSFIQIPTAMPEWCNNYLTKKDRQLPTGHHASRSSHHRRHLQYRLSQSRVQTTPPLHQPDFFNCVTNYKPLNHSTPSYNYLMSFKRLHQINERATPNKMLYTNALILHRIYNYMSASPNWMDLNFQQYFNNRIQTCNAYDTSNYTLGPIQ